MGVVGTPSKHMMTCARQPLCHEQPVTHIRKTQHLTPVSLQYTIGLRTTKQRHRREDCHLLAGVNYFVSFLRQTKVHSIMHPPDPQRQCRLWFGSMLAPHVAGFLNHAPLIIAPIVHFKKVGATVLAPVVQYNKNCGNGGKRQEDNMTGRIDGGQVRANCCASRKHFLLHRCSCLE